MESHFDEKKHVLNWQNYQIIDFKLAAQKADSRTVAPKMAGKIYGWH